MALLGQSLEKFAALCVGVTALAFGKADGAGQAGIALAGLAGLFVGKTMDCGPARARAVASIRKKLLETYSDEITKEGTGLVARVDLKRADDTLIELLPSCFLDHQSLAQTADSPDGFPKAAAAHIMACLAQGAPSLFAPEHAGTLPYRYASDVILAGIEAAFVNEDYYRKFERRLIIEMAQTGAQTLEEVKSLQPKMAEIVERLALIEANQSADNDIQSVTNQLTSLLSFILETPVEYAQVEEHLKEAYTRFKATQVELAQLKRLANELPEIKADLYAARAALDADGEIDLREAERRITHACQVYDTQEEKRRDARQVEAQKDAQNRAALYQARADLLMAQGRYEEAGDTLLSVANEIGVVDQQLETQMIEKASDAFGTIGVVCAQPGMLERQVELLLKLIESINREKDRQQWARLQSKLGDALFIMGKRVYEGAVIDAITAYRAALEEYTRDDFPLDWAATQIGLGDALVLMGDRGDNTALTEAVTAYRASLEVHTRGETPYEWALTQSGLGVALAVIGQRGDNTALRDAIKAFHAALEELTRDSVPLAWAGTQNNLGNALHILGECGDEAALRDAVAAFRAALEETPRKYLPLEWAKIQNNLGNALVALGERGNVDDLHGGITAYRAALEEYTRDKVPMDWARTKKNLGTALAFMGKYVKDTALRDAVKAYRTVLEEYSQDKLPVDWADTQNDLGCVLTTIGERGDDIALNEAVAAFHAALEEHTREKAPLKWAQTQRGLGIALGVIGWGGNGAALDRSVKAFRAALEETPRQNVPLDWAFTQMNLGNSLAILGARGNDAAFCDAIEAYRAALEELTREKVPLHWAMTTENLGDVLFAKNNKYEACKNWFDALSVYRQSKWHDNKQKIETKMRAAGIDPDAH